MPRRRTSAEFAGEDLVEGRARHCPISDALRSRDARRSIPPRREPPGLVPDERGGELYRTPVAPPRGTLRRAVWGRGIVLNDDLGGVGIVATQAPVSRLERGPRPRPRGGGADDAGNREATERRIAMAIRAMTIRPTSAAEIHVSRASSAAAVGPMRSPAA